MRLSRSSVRKTTPAPRAPMTIEAPATPAEALPEELIAARAYEIWERRGRRHGESEQDWFAAREELKQERLGWVTPAPGDRDRRSK